MRDRFRSLAAFGIGLALLLPTCAPDALSAVHGADVSVRRIDRRIGATPGRMVALVPGDFVVRGPDLRVVVGGMQRDPERRGAIIQVDTGATPEPGRLVTRLSPHLHAHGGRVPLETRAVHALWWGRQPALRVEAVAEISARQVEVVQLFHAGSVPGTLLIDTWVEHSGEGVPTPRTGFRVDWGGADAFMPGVGTLRDGAWHRADFIASDTRRDVVLLADRTAPVEAAASFEQHGASAFLSHTHVMTGADEERGAARAVVVTGSQGMGEAVRRLGWIRGEPFPEMLVTLPYRPLGSEVHVVSAAGADVVRALPDTRGRALVPLPAAYEERARSRPDRVYADAYGHARSDPVPIPPTPSPRLTLRIPRGGHIRIRAERAEDGAPISARLRIDGIHGTPTPALGPRHRAAGAGNTVVTLHGTVDVPVRPGRYRIWLSHGPEWSLLQEEVEVTETFSPRVDASLRHVVDPGTWIACDFHLHADPSTDSRVSLEDRVVSLLAEGVRFAVPTDHNHVTGYGPTLQALQISGLGSVSGVEVTTWDPAFGHFNAFPYPLDPSLPRNGAPEYQHTSPGRLFAALRRVDPDLAIQVNHPRLEGDIGYFDMTGFDPTSGHATGPYSDDFDVLEVWNGFDLAREERLERNFREWLALLERGVRVTASGNSDSHEVAYQWAGYPRTYVFTEEGDPADGAAVVRALKEGRAFVTNGPFLDVRVDGAGAGGSVSVPQSGARLRIRVQAPEWIDVDRIEVFLDGALAHTLNPGERSGRWVADREVALAAGHRFVVVRVLGDAFPEAFFGRGRVRPMAFSNPIWLQPGTDAGVPADAGAGRLDAARLGRDADLR